MPLGHPHAADVDRASRLDVIRTAHQLGRAAAEVDHEVGAGHADRPQVAGGAGEREPRLGVTGDDLGRDVEVAERLAHPGDELPRVARVPRGRGRDEAHPADAERSALLGVLAGHGQGARHRLGGDDAGAVDALPEPHDLHPAHDVGQQAVVTDVGDEQAQRVGAAVDGGHPRPDAVAHGALPASVASLGRVRGVGRAGVPLPPGVEHLERLVAERVDPGPGGERVGDQHVQALDPGRHAAGGDPGDLGHVAELGAALEVVEVRRGVPLAQLGVDLEPLGHLAHDALALQGRQRPGEAGTGGVERRRERRAVGQPGLGAHDVGLAARAAVGDLGDPAGLAPELAGDGVEVGLRDRRQVGACRHRRAPGTSAVRVDCHTVSYQGSGTSGAASSGTGSLVPVAGFASSTVYDRSPGLTNFSR